MIGDFKAIAELLKVPSHITALLLIISLSVYGGIKIGEKQESYHDLVSAVHRIEAKQDSRDSLFVTYSKKNAIEHRYMQLGLDSLKTQGQQTIVVIDRGFSTLSGMVLDLSKSNRVSFLVNAEKIDGLYQLVYDRFKPYNPSINHRKIQ